MRRVRSRISLACLTSVVQAAGDIGSNSALAAKARPWITNYTYAKGSDTTALFSE